MKVKFCCDNGANIHSKRTETFDLEKHFGISDEEWAEMSENAKNDMVRDWMWEHIDFWFEEV